MNNEKLVQNAKDINNKIRLSRGIRFMIFVIFWFIQLFNCSDGGVVSSSSNKIKQDLGFNDRQFGQYGSIVQLGRISGTFIVMILLNTLNRKFLMVFAICLKCSSFLIYFLTFNSWVVVAFRYLQGVSHVFPYVYFPTWCDQFGIQKYKTIMLSAMQTASPFGSVFGFSVTTFIGNWIWGFATLAFCILPLNLILAFIPDNYFSGKVYFYKQVEGGESEQKEDSRKSIYSLFEQTDTIRNKQGKGGNSSNSGNIWLSLFDGVFLFISLSRTVIMFIFMAIHYWLGDYYANVLGVTDKAQKAATYSFISLAGPSLGSMLGGTLCQWYAGGYDKKKAIFVCIFFSLLTSISAVFVSEVTTLYSFAVVLFCFFTFANGMMPILIGISFNCVPPKLRGSAYSVNSLLCTFLGNLPAPTVYGYLNDMFKEKDKRFAMRCIVNYIWVNFALLVLTAVFRYRRGDSTNKSDRPSKVQELGAGMEVSTGENPPPRGEKGRSNDEEKGTELQDK